MGFVPFVPVLARCFPFLPTFSHFLRRKRGGNQVVGTIRQADQCGWDSWGGRDFRQLTSNHSESVQLVDELFLVPWREEEEEEEEPTDVRVTRTLLLLD